MVLCDWRQCKLLLFLRCCLYQCTSKGHWAHLSLIHRWGTRTNINNPKIPLYCYSAHHYVMKSCSVSGTQSTGTSFIAHQLCEKTIEKAIAICWVMSADHKCDPRAERAQGHACIGGLMQVLTNEVLSLPTLILQSNLGFLPWCSIYQSIVISELYWLCLLPPLYGSDCLGRCSTRFQQELMHYGGYVMISWVVR